MMCRHCGGYHSDDLPQFYAPGGTSASVQPLAAVSDHTALLSGSRWGSDGAPTVVTYSFMTSLPSYSTDLGFRAFSESDKAAARGALSKWSAVSGIRFVEGSDPFGQIRFGYSAQSASSGYAYFPGTPEQSGDIFLNGNAGTPLAEGSWTYQTLLHEIGHAIGLKHPFSGTVTLASAADNTANTLMSYTSVGSAKSAPQRLDVDAVQSLYGTGFSYPLTVSWDDRMKRAVWGLSGTTSFTFGDGDDYVQGTADSDMIAGGAGNDVLAGGAGNDALDGGTGFDVVRYGGSRADYAVVQSGGSVIVTGPDGVDTLTSVERIAFKDYWALSSMPGWQQTRTDLTAVAAGATFTIRQTAMAPVNDPVRGALASKVTINGAEVVGVPPTLKKGWKVATTTDIDADGQEEIFFFGVDNVAGYGQGFGATWELNGSGQVGGTAVQFQMSREGWDVAGAADVNGSPGDEILWQNVLTGEKAIWTDVDRNGAVEGGFILTDLGADPSLRMIGACDYDRDGYKEFMLASDTTGQVRVCEATMRIGGDVSISNAYQTFATLDTFRSMAQGRGASFEIFPVLVG